MQKILTANRLNDGAVVYLGDGGWSERIDAAAAATDETTAAALEARGAQAVADRQVVDPYLIDVSSEGGHLVPVRLRERIRAAGPTVRPDLGQQAMQEHLV